MPYRFLANIGYLRDNFQNEKGQWKKVGKLFYSKEVHSLKVFLLAIHPGLCCAKPVLDDSPPFLQGEIVMPVENELSKIDSLFVGFISTVSNDLDNGKIFYAIKFDVVPFCDKPIWLDVNLEDKEDSKPHEDKDVQEEGKPQLEVLAPQG